MYTAKNVKIGITLHFAWKMLAGFLAYGFVVTALYVWADLKFLAIPFLPLGLIGTAVAFYVGFKNNSSYERLWEARKIWGSIVNLSRTFGAYTLSYLEAPAHNADTAALEAARKDLVYRHLAFVNALRIRLRSRGTWESNNDPAVTIVDKQTSFRNDATYSDIGPFLPAAEREQVLSKANPVTQILKEQANRITLLKQQGYIDDFRHMEFGRVLAELYNQQGGCERIKSFPFPRQYAYYTKLFVWVFLLVLPFGLVQEFSRLGEGFTWLTILFYTLVAWVFNTMEIIGDTSENPFDNGINDIPMTAICRTIEIDLREMLEEEQVPAPVYAVNNILM